MAIIIVGGLGTVHGAIVGALILGPLPELVRENVGLLDFDLPILGRPLIGETAADDGLLTAAAFSEIMSAALLIGFLLFQPSGIAGMTRALRARWTARSASSKVGTQDPSNGQP